MARALAILAGKDLRILWRDKFAMFWIIVFPVLFASFFGAVTGGAHGGIRALRVALVDEDHTADSRAFTARLASSESLSLQPMTRAAAQEAVRKGERAAMIVLPQGFSDSFEFKRDGEGSFELGADPSRRAEAGFLQGVLMQAWYQTMMDRWQDPARLRSMIGDARASFATASDISPEQRLLWMAFFGATDQFLAGVDPQLFRQGHSGFARNPIRTIEIAREQTGPRSAYEVMFPGAIMWAVMGCVAGFAISLVKERVQGTLLRLRAAPLSRTQILGGKALACFTASLVSVTLLVALGRVVYGIRVESPLLLALTAACVALGFVGIMMLLSTLGKTEEAVAGSAWATLLILAMIGGAMVPRFVMPLWLQHISVISPIMWGIYAMEGATWRQFSVGELLAPCGVLLAIGAVCFAAGVTLLSRSDS
jgi:ABC-2 type transport system permease protein